MTFLMKAIDLNCSSVAIFVYRKGAVEASNCNMIWETGVKDVSTIRVIMLE